MREYLLCLLAAAAVTYLTTPLVERFAIRFGFVAEVRDRDVHAESTPRLGGIAMMLGLITGLLLASKLPMMGSVFETGSAPLALLSGVAIIVLLGIVDDKWGLDAPIKLAGQVLAAGVMAFQGIAVIWLPIGGTFVLDPLTSVLFTVSAFGGSRGRARDFGDFGFGTSCWHVHWVLATQCVPGAHLYGRYRLDDAGLIALREHNHVIGSD